MSSALRWEWLDLKINPHLVMFSDYKICYVLDVTHIYIMWSSH